MSSPAKVVDTGGDDGGQGSSRPPMSQRISNNTSKRPIDHCDGTVSSDNEKNEVASKLKEDVELLKKGKLTDPILIKDCRSGEGGQLSAMVSSSPSTDHTGTQVRSKNKHDGDGYSPAPSVLPLGTTQSVHSPAHYPERLSSADTIPTPSLGLEEESFRRSSSPMSKSKKSVSGMSSMIDSHNYFSSDHEIDTNYDDYQFSPTTGIHGNTSKVVATQHRRRAWDWNILPKLGFSVLVRTHSFNVISVPIDGEIKQILYTPSYNKNFRRMNIFLSFNMDTKPKDALIHARRRLISFGNYITHYLKSRMYAYQCYPFFLQGLSEEDTKSKKYVSFNASHDYTEIEAMISLWYIQAQRFFWNTNSIFFSSEVIQLLLQRKANTRHQSTLQSTVLVQQSDPSMTTPKAVPAELLDDIDILLLRPLSETQLGWQLAYDEPNLSIADYPLDTTPWTMNESDADNLSDKRDPYDSSSSFKIVVQEDELEILDAKTAGDYLFDCMDRKISELGDDLCSSVGQKMPNATEEVSKETGTVDNSKKKASHGKLAKRSGLASLFKRKHTHSIPQTIVSEPAETQDTKTAGRTQSIQNAWLEDYFSRSLANYRRLGLPTQYFLPQEASSTSSKLSVDEEKTEARKAFFYNKESLQIVLPFADNTIPSVHAPWIWSCLCYTKWRSLLREMYRCIVPGGFALGSVYDLKISNTFSAPTDDSMQEFPTTLERDKTFDAISLEAINNGIHIFPTKHLVQAFKDVGFTNIKYSLLSLKTGDFSTEMGCLNELFSQITWDSLLREEVPDPSKPPKDTEPTTLFQRYIREHMGKIDENAGCLRTLLVVAQKPRKAASK